MNGPARISAQEPVECYAGYKGDETPRAVFIQGLRAEIAQILFRTRSTGQAGGPVHDVWRCRLQDGRVVTVARSDSGAWLVSAA